MPSFKPKLIIFVLICCGIFLILIVRTIRFSPPPNIILISIDTLRADHLGCYGYKRPTSPNIDALAKEGALFANAFSHTPLTTPSHMSMMTSLLPDVHQVLQGDPEQPGTRLADRIPTLAQILQRHGYATVGFTGGGNVAAYHGFDRGFDLYGRGNMGSFFSWLDANPGRKFFLFFHTYAVHDPYFPPPEFNRIFNPGYAGKIADSATQLSQSPGSGEWDKRHQLFWSVVNKEDPEDVAFLEAQYDACIKAVDSRIIRPLVDKLKERNLFTNTLIVFTSDHGEAFKEHDNFLHDDLYAETLHVPLLLVYPQRVPRNKTVGRLARIIDIMPTILDLAGIRKRTFTQGVSLAPSLKGRIKETACYSSVHYLQTLRKGGFCFAAFGGKDGRIEKRRLFDTAADPAEKDDLFMALPEIAGELENEMNRILEASKRLSAAYPKTPAPEPGPADKNILRSLGYLK